MEDAVLTLQTEMAEPTFYQQDPADIAPSTERLKALTADLKEAYARWEERKPGTPFVGRCCYLNWSVPSEHGGFMAP